MKSALLVALFAVLAISAFADASYEFSGNATVSDPDGTLTWRSTSMGRVGLAKLVGFSSVAVDVVRNGSNTQVNVDTLGGYISYNQVPGALLSYFTGSLTLDPNAFDVSTAKNLMAKAYYRLDEVDASNNIVHTYWLAGNNALDLDWDLEVSSAANLKWAELSTDIDIRGNASLNDFDLSVTFFLSNVIGRLNVGGTVMTPRSLESVIRIKDYVYASATNKLVLYMAVAHGQTRFNAEGDFITTGSELQQIYVQLAASCQVAASADALTGPDRAVVTGTWTSNSTIKGLIAGSDFAAQLNSKFNSNWDIRTISITFPANASNIIYDPTLGAGKSVSQTPGSPASATIPSLLLLAVAALFGLFYL